MATATPSKDASGPSQPAPMLKRKNRRTRRKPQAAAQKNELNDGEDDEDANDGVAAWQPLPPAPNAVQGKQLEKALSPPPEKQESGGKKDAFSIVLELNLEIEVTIKARIHGDLTLALIT